MYALRLVQESNQRGLGLFINGQPLNSDTAQLAFSVSAGVNVWATLEVRRGEGSFDFPGVQIEMLAISPGGGDCTAVSATLNTQFDQPCAQIAFAGSVAVAVWTLTSTSARHNVGQTQPAFARALVSSHSSIASLVLTLLVFRIRSRSTATTCW